MPVLYALWRNTRRRLAERLTFETCVLKLSNCRPGPTNPEARHCDAGVTQNLPTLDKADIMDSSRGFRFNNLCVCNMTR
jgi:hypothetical protein